MDLNSVQDYDPHDMQDLSSKSLEDREKELKDRESRLIAIINTLGYTTLDSIENFICSNNSVQLISISTSSSISSPTTLSSTKESYKKLNLECVDLKDKLDRTNAELHLLKVLLEGEKEKVNELNLKLESERISDCKVVVDHQLLQNADINRTHQFDTPIMKQNISRLLRNPTPSLVQPATSKVSATPISSTPKFIGSNNILLHPVLSPAASVASIKRSISPTLPKLLDSSAQRSSTPLQITQPTLQPIPSNNASASTSKLIATISKPSASTKPLLSQSSVSSLSRQDTRLENYPALLKSYYEVRRSVQNYRLGAIQHVNPKSSRIQPSLDFDFPDFDDLSLAWTLDGSLKKRFDVLKSKESEARQKQSELREWKDAIEKERRLKKKTIGNDIVAAQERKTISSGDLISFNSSKDQEKQKENFQNILQLQETTRTPTQIVVQSSDNLGTTPRKGKREDKWLMGGEVTSTAKKPTRAINISPISVLKSKHESSEPSTQDDSPTTQEEYLQEVEDEEDDLEDMWPTLPSVKPSFKNLTSPPKPASNSPSQSSPTRTSPALFRRKAKISSSSQLSSQTHTSFKNNNLSPLRSSPRKKSTSRLNHSSPPPTFLPSSAHSGSSTIVLRSQSRRTSNAAESAVNELRYYALLGSPPPPAPQWSKLKKEEKKEKEREEIERAERRSKNAATRAKNLELEEEKAAEAASKKKGGKRRREEQLNMTGESKFNGKKARIERTGERNIEINPARNNGKDYHYSEVVRNKEARKEMHAEACDCCTEYYKRDLGDSKEKGDGNHFLSDRHKAMQARLQQNSRHRQHHRPDPDPPEYWQMGFPTTQVVERINKKAEVLRKEKRNYQEAEAEQENGFYRWAKN